MAARVGVVLLALAVAACSGDGAEGGPGTSGPATAVPATPSTPGSSAAPAASTLAPSTTPLPVDTGELGILDGALQEDGTVGLDQALALVAAGYGPLPGVDPAPAPLVDGGPALRTVVANVEQLRDDQRAALERITSPSGTPPDQVAATAPRLAAAAQIVTSALATFAQAQARPLPPDVRVTILELPYDNGDGTHNFSSPESHATALLLGDEADAECRIRVNATSTLDPTAGLADPAFVSTLAREAFHCVQYAVAPELHDVPVWVVEGGAAFAGEDVAGPSTVSSAWWGRWVGQPQRPLDRRTYDAIGFFAMLDESANAYAFAEALLGDPSAGSVRRRLELTDLFDRWGQHYATEPAWGLPFTFAAPGATGLVAPQEPVVLGVDGTPVALGGPAITQLSAVAYRFTPPGDVLVVSTSPADRGGLRFGDGQALGLAEATQSFCLRSDGCACPGMPPGALPISQVGSTELFIGVGPSSGGGPELAARSLARWCQEVLVPPPPADAVDPCLVGTWTSRAYVAPETAGIAQTVTGGDGAIVEFAPDRTVRVDMTATRPVVITATGQDGVVTTTTLEYRGAGSGTWSAADGVVEVAGIDTTTFAIRVRIETTAGGVLSDVELPLADLRLAGYASVPGTSRYECTAVSLTIARVVPGVGGRAGFELAP